MAKKPVTDKVKKVAKVAKKEIKEAVHTPLVHPAIDKTGFKGVERRIKVR